MSPLPIGNDFHTISERPCWGMEISSPQDQELLLKSTLADLRPRNERIPGIYVDFAWQGAYVTRSLPGARVALNRGEIVKSLLSNKLCFFQSRSVPRLDLWRTRGKYAFVVSPHGNGLDCHRTWEALSLGHIVIVPSSSLDSLYTGLPVVCVDRFDDIPDQKLEHWLHKFHNIPAGREKLTNSYWVNKMSRQNYASPFVHQGSPSGTTLHRIAIGRILIEAYEWQGSLSAGWVANELQRGYYGLYNIPFQQNDIVIDIGAHIGLVAIYLGLRFPGIKIHSFEPFPDNYELAKLNLSINHVTNVELHPLAVTSDGRAIEMATDPKNSGGATSMSSSLQHRRTSGISSTTLDSIFEAFSIRKCKLLKIDCEGSEHEILTSTTRLRDIEYLIGEFHINARLVSEGHTVRGLISHCAKSIHPSKIMVTQNQVND